KVADEWASWFSNAVFPDDAEWQGEFEKRFAVIDDATFTFLAEFATEVNAHIKIQESTGTVEDGALWYQESLPAETILVAAFQADRSRKKDQPLSPSEV